MLDKKLQWLSEHADFHVNINSVVGGGIKDPQDALTIGRRAVGLGFTSTIGIIHDGDGQLKPLGGEERSVWTRDAQLEEEEELLPVQSVPGSYRQRPTQRLALPRGVRVISTSAKTASCITARSNAGSPGFHWPNTSKADVKREFLTEKTCAPQLHHQLRSHRCPISTTGAHRRFRQTTPGAAAGLINIQL